MLLGWLILGFMLLAAWPWARWIAARSASDEDQLLLSLLLCIGLGSGVLSLLILWVGEPAAKKYVIKHSFQPTMGIFIFHS